MNHDEATRYFDTLGENVPDRRPPMSDLITAGKAAERRRTRKTLGVVAAAVALILGGGAIAQQAIADGDGKEVERDLADVPRAPDGMRLVGMGRVAVAVPETWGIQQLECGEPTSDTVYFDARAPLCGDGVHGFSSLAILDEESEAGRNAAEYATTSESVNGVDVVRGRAKCPSSASCVLRYEEVLVVPEQGVVFGVTTGSEGASAVLDSVQLLPEGYTTVPFIEPGTRRSDAESTLESAGLDAYLNARDFDAPDVTGTDPEPGSVVHLGDTVTLTLSDPVIALPEWNSWPATDVSGTLSLSHGCLLLDDSIVLWPHGSTWNPATQSVVVGGAESPVGGQVEGGGGFYEPGPDFSDPFGGDAYRRAQRCLDETGAENFVVLSPDSDSEATSMTVSPSTARPGEVVSLMFPTKQLRGADFRLAARVGNEWIDLYQLFGTDSASPQPSWLDVDEAVGVGDIGIGGPGPDFVTIPEVAEPGDYRLCTANAAQQMCVELAVAAADETIDCTGTKAVLTQSGVSIRIYPALGTVVPLDTDEPVYLTRTGPCADDVHVQPEGQEVITDDSSPLTLSRGSTIDVSMPSCAGQPSECRGGVGAIATYEVRQMKY